jgi:hypothetical protein
MLRLIRWLTVAVLALGVVAIRSAYADASTLRPTERDPRLIMQAVHRQGGEGAPRIGKLRLTTTSSAGKRERVLQVRYKGDANTRRSMLLVEAPDDVRGTGFVSIEYPSNKQPAERWLYLANLKRSTRIAGGKMSGSFMGSDLSFTDLSQPDPGLFDFSMVKDTEQVGSEDCWVILAKAKDPKTLEESGYTQVQFWISKQKLSIVRMRAPLTNGKTTKYMESSEFAMLADRWTAKRIVIRSVESGKVASESVLETLELRTDTSVQDSDFSQRRLELGP